MRTLITVYSLTLLSVNPVFTINCQKLGCAIVLNNPKSESIATYSRTVNDTVENLTSATKPYLRLLLEKYQLTNPLVLSKNPTWYERMLLESFLNDLLALHLNGAPNYKKHQVECINRSFFVEIFFHPSISNNEITSVQKSIRGEIVPLLEGNTFLRLTIKRDPSSIDPVLLRELISIDTTNMMDPLMAPMPQGTRTIVPTNLKEEFIENESEMKGKLPDNPKVNFSKIWSKILAVVQNDPNIDLDKKTYKASRTWRKIKSKEKLIPDAISGFVTLEQLTIEIIHRNPNLVNCEIEVFVDSCVRIRRLSSRKWISISKSNSAGYNYGILSFFKTNQKLVSLDSCRSSQHKCMQRIIETLSKIEKE